MQRLIGRFSPELFKVPLIGVVLALAALGCDAQSAAGFGAAGAAGGASLGGSGAAGQNGSGTANAGSANAGSGNGATSESTSGAVNAPKGGSRLKARVAEAPSGAFQFLGWQDTELDMQCRFQALPSGQLACLPNGDDMAWISSEPSPAVFADAACSIPTRHIESYSCRNPSFAQVLTADASGDTCQSTTTYLRVGSSVRFPYKKVGDECQLDLSLLPSTGNLFEVEPFPIEGFAVGTLRDGVAAEGIAPRYLTAEDGAEAFWGFHDVNGDFDCQLATMTEGVRCVPINMPMLTGINFADSNCTAPAAMAATCSDADAVPYVLDVTAQASQDSVWHVFEGGARLETSYTGSSAPGACIADQSDLSIFSVGEEVDGSRFVTGALDEDPDPAGLIASVLHAGGWSTTADSPIRSQGFTGYQCTVRQTRDGVTRCVPSSINLREYADAACSESEMVIDGWGTTGAVSLGEQCGEQVTVYALGEEYSGPIYRKDGEQCVFDRDQPPQPSRMMTHRLGDELPPESFPELSITLR